MDRLIEDVGKLSRGNELRRSTQDPDEPDFLPVPGASPRAGWYALSVTEIHGRDRAYEYFLRFKPVAMAGYSIYVYRITPDDARQTLRSRFGPE